MLSELQQRRFNGSDGGVSWSPMDDELLAQPQVMKLLDSLREQYTRYQEVCRQRSKRTQLEEIQQKVMQVRVRLGGLIPENSKCLFLDRVCYVTGYVEDFTDFKLGSCPHRERLRESYIISAVVELITNRMDSLKYKWSLYK